MTEIKHTPTPYEELVDALEAWQQYDSESADKHPCPDYVLRTHYKKIAREKTDAVLAKIKQEQARE